MILTLQTSIDILTIVGVIVIALICLPIVFQIGMIVLACVWHVIATGIDIVLDIFGYALKEYKSALRNFKRRREQKRKSGHTL